MLDSLDLPWESIPTQYRMAIRDWIERGLTATPLIEALVENDLRRALHHAESPDLLVEAARWMHEHAPKRCWGSREVAEEWSESGGSLGRRTLTPVERTARILRALKLEKQASAEQRGRILNEVRDAMNDMKERCASIVDKHSRGGWWRAVAAEIRKEKP